MCIPLVILSVLLPESALRMVPQECVPRLNSERFAERFKAAGGGIRVEKRGLCGYHPHGFEYEDVCRVVDFFEGK